MLKKSNEGFASLLIITALFCMSIFGCSRFSPEMIYGQWKGECQLKSDVNFSGSNPQEPEASIYFKQEVVYNFSSDGIFTKETTQKYIKTVPINENALIPSDEQLSGLLNKKMTVTGTYTLTKDRFSFLNKTVKAEDGKEMSFEEYSYSNPTAEEESSSTSYSLVEDSLVLNEITFKKKQ